jgi:hypothetical protein
VCLAFLLPELAPVQVDPKTRTSCAGTGYRPELAGLRYDRSTAASPPVKMSFRAVSHTATTAGCLILRSTEIA